MQFSRVSTRAAVISGTLVLGAVGLTLTLGAQQRGSAPNIHCVIGHH